ncbi:MAG TPA: arylsulfatase [Candidatus Aminicenantes bacterium]|nr:arylsulfatase [Candidatus Aminicenantes bacterium]HRY64593.1 arylsulfatase [Candidatus Aminicenantes bacterium]HRZ71506.1 arylsulfatase [Candidatus Aminicenantes bacterium]
MSINRRQFIRAAGLGAAAAWCGGLPSCRGSRRPNIVVIMADDMGFGDAGCYNPASLIPTPHIDRLASEGARFTDAHSPSSVCTPTRYGLLTGRYAWRTWLRRGVIGGYTPPLIEPARPTIASVLGSHGYRTGFFGKWHLGLGWTRANGFVPGWKDAERMFRGSWQDPAPSTGLNVDFTKPVHGGPAALGFDEAFFTAACSTIDGPFTFIENDRVTVIPDRQVSEFYDMTGGEEGSPRPGWIAPGFRLEDVDLHFTERAVRFLERSLAAAPRRPVFVELALSSPHTPWLVPDLVRGRSGDGPRGDLVALADLCVGRIMETLDRSGAAGDTLLVFMSDNGPHPGTNGHASAGALRGLKSHIWEGGHRVPFIARWPGRTGAGAVIEEPICLTDLMATFAAVAGAELPPEAGPDSVDISPALVRRGGPDRPPLREAIISHSEDGTFAVRRGPWKLILDNKTSGGWMVPEGTPPAPGTPGQLYDLAGDPGETRDMWAERPEIVAELASLLERCRRDGRSVPPRVRR